jgi:hypothetical protein
MDIIPIIFSFLKALFPFYLAIFIFILLKVYFERLLLKKNRSHRTVFQKAIPLILNIKDALSSYPQIKQDPGQLIELHPSKFYKKAPLTEPEQITYFKLVSALPNYIILPQVSFGSFITTKGGTAKQNFSRFGQARQKVIDFLVCDKSFEIIAAIELDDSSHIGREEQDEKKNDILKEAGINIIRWYMKSQPDKESLIKMIKDIQSN